MRVRLITLALRPEMGDNRTSLLVLCDSGQVHEAQLESQKQRRAVTLLGMCCGVQRESGGPLREVQTFQIWREARPLDFV